MLYCRPTAYQLYRCARWRCARLKWSLRSQSTVTQPGVGLRFSKVCVFESLCLKGFRKVFALCSSSWLAAQLVGD